MFEVLRLGASAGAGHRLNLLLVFRQGAEQLLWKDGRLLRLKHLEYHGLIPEGALVAGVRWKSWDAVGNNRVDVADRLGGHIVCWLVVAGLDGRELLLQQLVNGIVLGNVDQHLLHGLATGENIEHVSCKLSMLCGCRFIASRTSGWLSIAVFQVKTSIFSAKKPASCSDS